jgi:predicted RecA/RadA family phage recombinase
MATFLSEGNRIDYTPDGAAASAGDVVVIGDLVGVVVTDLADGEKGSLQVDGLIECPIAAAAAAAGSLVYWDDTEEEATATADSLKKMGFVVQAAATDGGLGRVLLKQLDT